MPYPSTKNNIVLLGFASFLNDISSEIIQPILPLFVTSLGGGSLAIGLIGGISDGLPSLLKVFSGYWSDRQRKRKPLVVGGYSLSAAAKLLLAFSSTWQQVFVFKILERCGKGVRSAPRDSIISESSDKSSWGKGFGLHRTLDSAGAVIGSILAYLLWQGGLGHNTILLMAGVLAILALIPLVRVHESYVSPSCQLRLKLHDLSPDLRKFVAIASIFALGNFSYMFFILRAQSFFSGAQAVALPLMLYVLFNVVYAGLAMPVGIWSDRIGRKRVLILGYALFSMTAIGFAFVSSLAGLALLFALYGLVFALVNGSERAFVSDLSQARVRGTCLGIYYGFVGASAVVSSLAAGWLWAQHGPFTTFFFGAAAGSLATLSLLSMNLEKAAA